MPSQTYYLDREHMEFLDALCDSGVGIDNPSQAVKYCINQQMQRDIINEEHDNE